MITEVIVNGEKFFTGKDCDEFKISYPTDAEPYWQIDFYLNKEFIKRILATGNVMIKYEEEV